MLYQEFEPKVLALLRSGRLADAVILISKHRDSFAGAERYDYLSLKATVRLQASPLNAMVCAGLVDKILAAPEARPLTKLRASFLGAHIADQLDDADAWRGYMADMFEHLPADERFRGRALRGQGDFKAQHGTPDEAIAAYEAARVWQLCNVGPYDERDRLCVLGLVCADLVRLLAREGRISEAQAAADTVRASIPEDAFQRVYVPISDAHIGLATNNLPDAEAAIGQAGIILSRYPNEWAARQLECLQVALLRRQGCTDQAQAALDGMATRGGQSRDIASLRSSQALAIQSG